jgi:hypothetical protein
MTFTRTHVTVEFANPHLVCDKCRQPVTSWHDNTRCGCGGTCWNNPCGCEYGGVTSSCPSWGPVDGCTCTPRHIVPAGAIVARQMRAAARMAADDIRAGIVTLDDDADGNTA